LNNPQASINPFRKEQNILHRCRFWQQVIQNPQIAYPDAAQHQYAAAQYRRDAIRNLNKLLKKHPHIAERLRCESEVRR
jgi:hypothetical protein